MQENTIGDKNWRKSSKRANAKKAVVGRIGFEPMALSLKVRCSTPELTTRSERIIDQTRYENQPFYTFFMNVFFTPCLT